MFRFLFRFLRNFCAIFVRLPLGFRSAFARLLLGFRSAFARLLLGFRSAFARLSLGFRSAFARPFLGFRSVSAQLWLIRIFPQILLIFLGYNTSFFLCTGRKTKVNRKKIDFLFLGVRGSFKQLE